MQGLKVFGRGKWRQISRLYLGRRKTPTQASNPCTRTGKDLPRSDEAADRLRKLVVIVTGPAAGGEPCTEVFCPTQRRHEEEVSLHQP